MVATSRVVLRGARWLLRTPFWRSFFPEQSRSPSRSPATRRTKPRENASSPGRGSAGRGRYPADRVVYTSEAPGTIIIDTGERHLLSRPAERSGHPLRHRRRTCRFPMVGSRASVPETSVAGLARPTGNGRTAALSASVHGGRSGQSPRGASPLSRSLRLPHPRNQPAGDDRARRFVGMLSPRQRRRNRPLRPRPGRRKSPRQAVGPRFLMRARGLKVGGLCREGIPASPANVLAPAHRLEGHAGRAIPPP